MGGTEQSPNHFRVKPLLNSFRFTQSAVLKLQKLTCVVSETVVCPLSKKLSRRISRRISLTFSVTEWKIGVVTHLSAARLEEQLIGDRRAVTFAQVKDGDFLS